MSVRDTGWRRDDPAKPWCESRQVGPFLLDITKISVRVWGANGCLHTEDRLTRPRASAKRAAEDALRTLCRDTLTALGDGDV